MAIVPYSWPPSEYWDGDDGSWSSFNLRIGKPAQDLRVLPSTAGQAIWSIAAQGCVPSPYTALNCAQERGGILNPNVSQTWESKGFNALGLEANFGVGTLNASYGLDTVALGLSNSTGGPVLTGQLVAGLGTNTYYMGTFGLGQQPTNLTVLDNSYPSSLATLASQSIIPSRSWGYTAGAPYRLKGVYGSLTLGGYDASRFIPNGVPFHFAGDISRDLVVGLQSITSKNSTGSSFSLLPSPILTFIDSTWPYIYLPYAACQLFEQALGLTWNPSVRLYTIDETLHRSLLASNPNFTFTIADSIHGGATVDLVLPYASFDLVATFPLVSNKTRYFPLKRAANETQYTLGRTFLQEAYLTTNYENSTFSVSQCKFEEGVAKRIVPIYSASTTPSSASHLGTTGIAGITSGITIFLLLSILILTYVLRKRRSRRRRAEQDAAAYAPTNPPGHLEAKREFSLREIDENSLRGIREFPDSGKAELLDSSLPNELPDSGKAELRGTKSARRLKSRVQELPSQDQPWLQELPASSRPTKPAPTRLSCPRSKFALTLSAEHRRGSRIRHNEIGISYHSSRVASIITLFRGAPDLDRPLPPTPISESPQVERASNTTEGRLIDDILLFYYRSRRGSYRPESTLPGLR